MSKRPKLTHHSAPDPFTPSQPTGPNIIPPIRLPPRNLNTLNQRLTQSASISDDDESEGSVIEESINDMHTFCKEEMQQPLIKMLKKHYNAHPSIPGNYNPCAEGVREWAVRKAYDFCRENNSPELWAYLWENWYRAGRWQLWARATCREIPRLRTTMIAESHWRHLKRDWLHFWPKMRLDLLIWTVIIHIEPKYNHRALSSSRPSERTRDAASWRKQFRYEWRKCEATPTSDPDDFPYIAYDPNPYKWICGCNAYLTSRFAICKHLIQLCHRVPPTFFFEANRNRDSPTWTHPSLVPLYDETGNATIPPVTWKDAASFDVDDLDLEIADFDDGPPPEEVANFSSEMEIMANELAELASYIRYQISFKEVRVLSMVRQRTKTARNFYADIKSLERVNNNPHGSHPTTWGSSNLLFWYTRPAVS